ncbi:MAG: hypothetical protein EOO85_11830 [Pedobacter sp.]|nr:MAG: hypothetical protein EOO85_11830 [Pedobacter sp.]
MNSFPGAIIGAILGFISSFGFMAMNIKKSQRSQLFPIIAVITTVFGAVGGARIGFNLQRSDRITQSLGLDKMKQTHYKNGKSWESQSSWIDVQGKHHVVTTLKSANYSNATVSLYNGTLIFTHGTSASSINIARYHSDAKKSIIIKLKDLSDS